MPAFLPHRILRVARKLYEKKVRRFIIRQSHDCLANQANRIV